MKVFLISLIICIGSLANADITPKSAFDFLSTQGLIDSSINAGLLQLKMQDNGWVLVEGTPRKFLLQESEGKIKEFFYEQAALISKAILILSGYKWDVSNGVTMRLKEKTSIGTFAIEVTDTHLIAEALRNVHFYSEQYIPTLSAVRTQDLPQTTKKNPAMIWSKPFSYTNGVFSEVEGVRISLGDYSSNSPEIYDGFIASFLFNPDGILKSPFIKDKMVKFMPWSQTIVAVLNAATNATIANMTGVRLIPYGSDAPTVVDEKPELIKFKETMVPASATKPKSSAPKCHQVLK